MDWCLKKYPVGKIAFFSKARLADLNKFAVFGGLSENFGFWKFYRKFTIFGN